MKWMKFRIKTITQAEDIIISTLYDIGLEGAQIEDKVPLTAWEKEQMFVDILPEGPEDDGIAYLSFFVEEAQEEEPASGSAWRGLVLNGQAGRAEDIRERVQAELKELQSFMEIGEGAVTVEETEDVDWINNWKQYFKPFTVDHILIKPTWETIPEEHKDKLLVQIDPGTAFGTGMHETTQLCIRQLEKRVDQDTLVLDVGTGSGILGITALKLGAKEVWGTDLDENAITAVGENLEANSISTDRFHVIQGNIIDNQSVKDWAGYDKYDIVVANILADVISLLVNEIPAHLKQGGYFITSGIINMKEEAVKAAFAECEELELVEVTYQGEWVSVTARKR